jgi:uncharacterized protein
LLQLRPNCENCNKALPPNADDARICSFECTFCASCVEQVLQNVCPNCGGAFCARPIRPVQPWKAPWYLGVHPGSTIAKHRPVDSATHSEFAARIAHLPPALR